VSQEEKLVAAIRTLAVPSQLIIECDDLFDTLGRDPEAAALGERLRKTASSGKFKDDNKDPLIKAIDQVFPAIVNVSIEDGAYCIDLADSREYTREQIGEILKSTPTRLEAGQKDTTISVELGVDDVLFYAPQLTREQAISFVENTQHSLEDTLSGLACDALQTCIDMAIDEGQIPGNPNEEVGL